MNSIRQLIAPLGLAIALFFSMNIHAMSLESMGLAAYQNLKNDQYDFSIIERAGQLLTKLDKSGFRPNHCPLNQTTGQDLLEKLAQLQSALQSSACKEYKDGFLTSFSTSVSKIGQTYLASPMKETNTGSMTPLAQQAYYRNIGDMVGSLSSLVSDSRCAFDIKERGLIPVVSEILGSASVSALHMPSQYAFLAGMSGLAITSSLKIISGLLQPDYDMSKPKDRENFVKLACSFYDLRTDLEKNNFLRIPSDRDTVNHLLLQSYIKSMESMVAWLDLARSESLAHLKSLKDAYVVDQLGAAKFAFYGELPALKASLLKDTLKEAANPSPSRSLSYRFNLMMALEKIAWQVPHLSIEPEVYNFFSDVAQDLEILTNYKAILSAKDAHKKTDQELSSIFVEALANIEAIIAQQIMVTENAWLEQAYDAKTNFAQLTTGVSTLFDEHIQKIRAVMAKLTEKEIEIGKILARKNFTADDEGTHIDHAIVEEVKTIQKAIYGHYGWKFYEYVRDNATEELTAFFNNFSSFHMKHFPARVQRIAKIKDEYTRRIACATASDILLSINNSRSLVNMATDFIFTNRDFFHENVGAIDFHLKVIPTGRSIERQLLSEAKSMINTHHKLAHHKSAPFPSVLLDANYFNRPKVGDLMMGQTYADRTIAFLYQFQTVNGCGR